MNLRQRAFVRRISAALLLAFVLAPSASLAEPAGDAKPTEAAKAAARTLGKEGQEALEHKDYAVAAEKFARADRTYHAPTLLLGLARAQVGLGKLVEARETYDHIVRDGAPPGSAQAFVTAVEDARREGASLSARIPTVAIDVFGPRDPQIAIDGVPIPTPAIGTARPIDPGKHRVQASAPGFVPLEQELTATEGVAGRVELRLLPAGEAPPGPAASPPSGPAGERAAAAPSGPSRFPWKPIGYGALGLGAVGLIIGGITGGLAIGKHGELNDACYQGTCPTDVKSVNDALGSYHTLGTVSTIGFVLGGVFAAGGITVLIAAPKSRPDGAAPKAAIAPYLGPGQIGAMGSF
jgi:hypothetical protein